MDKKILFGIIIGTVAILVLAMFSGKSPKYEGGVLDLFFRTGCPHCENVQKFIDDNKVEEKISINHLDATIEENSLKMLQYAKKCSLDTATLGVPFLWTGSTCLMGDVDINAFLKQNLK